MLGLLPTAFDFKTGYDRDVLIYLAKNVDAIPHMEHTEVFITLAEESGQKRKDMLYRGLKSHDQMHTHFARYGKKVGTKKNPFVYSEEKYDAPTKQAYGVMHENKVHEQRNKGMASQDDFELLVLDDQHMYWLNKARSEWGLELEDLMSLAYQEVNGLTVKGKDASEAQKKERRLAVEALSMLRYLAETHKDFAGYLQDYLMNQTIKTAV